MRYANRAGAIVACRGARSGSGGHGRQMRMSDHMAPETAGRARDRVNDRDRQRAATHDRIRTVALEVIGRDGLGAARIGDIAASAGVSRGTVYFHYPKIEDIAAEVLVEAETRIGRAVLQ